MRNLKGIITVLVLTSTFGLNAQVAPTTGEKVLKVKETYLGEYLQSIDTTSFSSVVVNAIKERVPKKLIKYGFTDIKILKVGRVNAPISTATKMSNFVGGNEAVGKDMLKQAKSYSEIVRAIDKMYEPKADIDWKMQVIILDNLTHKEFKIKIASMTYAPQYIIKESDLVLDLRKD
ncbi:hypothetical protein LPB87_10035 [Flavobacterium sp. EDS]|uniref:hypothetical protein n=1 Tax=Flavobacterium sp. EDS TaxID=2897328 RepID=UPI001E588C4A|nr:hypothetical protein [Flavobacterium sp. EDS]MCD0474728.1 hypothetical protein [Flavobacterium sp. EDS]